MLGRLHRLGESHAGVADDAASALHAAHMARREPLAVLQGSNFEVDRLIGETAGGKQKLQAGREPVPRYALRGRVERLPQYLAAVDASMFVRLGASRLKAALRDSGETKQVCDVLSIPFGRVFPCGGERGLHVQHVHLWCPVSLMLATP
jgi:hypothetical protein